jgi:hypothetical protein
MSTLFDYRTLAGQLRIGAEELAELEECVRTQYGPDEMMVELRILRTLEAVKEGALSLAEAIAEFRGDPVHPSGAGA